MNVKKGGLGRGLGALIPTSATVGEPLRDEPATQGVVVPGAEFREIPLDAVRPNPKQPRQVFDEEALAELVTSIREVGLLQPIVVRALDDGQYELVMGERRWRASRLAGLDAIPAIVRDTGDDAMLRDALLENLHRQQLNPLEEAAAYAQLLEEFGATHEELASRIGRSRPQVSNTLRLLNLPPAVQRRVAAGVISAGHARALLSLDDAEEQERLAGRIVAEGLSVRAIEEIVAIGDVTAVPARSARAKAPVAPGLVALAERLSDRFETRVKVEVGRQRGKVVVEFATLDDLERILQVMAPDALPSLAPPSEPTSSDPNGRHELDPVAERDHPEQHSGESSETEHGVSEHVQPGDAAEFREGEHQPGTSWG